MVTDPSGMAGGVPLSYKEAPAGWDRSADFWAGGSTRVILYIGPKGTEGFSYAQLVGGYLGAPIPSVSVWGSRNYWMQTSQGGSSSSSSPSGNAPEGMTWGVVGEISGQSSYGWIRPQITFDEPVRTPDYVTVTGAIFAGVGGGISLTIDKWGRRYWNLNKGFGIGKGVSIVFGTIFDGPHDKAAVAAFLNSTSFTFQGDFGAAGGFTTSVDTGTSAYEIGAGGPGFSFTWNSDLLKGW